MPARKGGHEIFAEIGKTGLTNAAMRGIIYLAFAGVAHLVERDLAKVEVASSSLVARSKMNDPTQFEQVDETCRLGRVVLYSKSLGMAGVS